MSDLRNFDDSTLWRISEFERFRSQTGNSGYVRLAGPTVLPTTLLADLRAVERLSSGSDLLEVVAACMRHREAALLYLRLNEVVWPVTLFPLAGLFHSPLALEEAMEQPWNQLQAISYEPPGVRPPGHWMHERISRADHYSPLPPLLWALAMKGPRDLLLNEIGGTAAYRVLPGPIGEGLSVRGALGSAVDRLRRESASLRDISRWPGLSVERASRLLNALYLVSSLMVTRANRSAHRQPSVRRFGLPWGKR